MLGSFITNAQLTFYIDGQLVDQTQTYYFNSDGTAANYLMELENTSLDTLQLYVDICIVDESPAWEMNSCVWAHEDDLFGGMHAVVGHDTALCWNMAWNGFEVEVLNSEKALLASYFDIFDAGCEKYRYYVRDNNTILDSIDVMCCSSLGLDEQNKAEVSVFPNPAKEKIYVAANEIIEGIILIDLQGRVVLERKIHSTTKQVELDLVSEGLYQLLIQLENGSQVVQSVRVH